MARGDRSGTYRRSAAVFDPGDPPRTGTVAFWSPAGEAPPEPDGERELAVRAGDGDVVLRTVPVVRVPIADALPILARARRTPDAHPSSAFWGAAAVLALQLVARGRILPGLTPGDHDAWRVGPLDAADVERIRALAAAMPAEARAIPLPGGSGGLPPAEQLVRDFLDAVADTLPRSPAAARAVGGAPFAAAAPQHLPGLRGWAREVSAGIDTGLRTSLRVEATDPEQAAFRLVVQLHSLADPALVTDARELWAGGAERFGPRARIEAMLSIRRAALVWAPLGRLLDGPVPDAVDLSDEELAELFGWTASRLAAAGVDVHWPRDLVRDLTATAVVGASEPERSEGPSFFGGDRTFGLEWRVALRGEPLTAAEMDVLAEAHRPVVRLRDQWMLVDPELARKARDRRLKPLTAADALGAALTGTAELDGERVAIVAGGALEALRRRIAEPDEGHEPIRPPAALAATLRDYQLRGLRWLDRMTSLGLGVCLADDMGLGKTVMLIALHLHRQADPATVGPTLVVCPASLLGNWEREIERFAPGTPVRRFHGAGRSLDGADAGFVLTTYGTMRLDADRLGTHRWGLLVADEAQHVKNHRSGTARALRRIGAAAGTATARVALTGTPVENNLSELWAILDWTTPGLLGSLTAFRHRWARPIEAGGDTEAGERLSRLVRPFLLRRRKSDPGIAPELPPKTVTDQPVALTREQAGLYEAAVRELMADVRGSTGMARRGRIVKLLTALKQICNHPAQYLGEADPRLSGRSGKLELLDELLDTITAEGGAVLVFTQYVTMARLLRRHLDGRGIPSQLLHGGTPVRRREEMVERFQAGDVPVFLLSLKAAGTGLNLTRADHVVHYDRWWNPAVEEQATDRAYRIGQTRPVQVHRMVTEGTVEDRIAAMLTAKQALADAVLGAGDAALSELTDVELAALVELRSP
jgi:superfamily II DNA or RNA helicase